MLKMILVGACGTMGHVVAGQSYHNGFEIVAGIDRCEDSDLPFPVYDSFDKCAHTADVVIDFSHPAILSDLLAFSLKNRLPVVVATTGMNEEHIESIQRASEQIPVFFTFNMSLGVSLLTKLAQQAAALLGGSFDVEIIEKHHNQKIDAPSGTAIMLANAVKESLPFEADYIYERQSKRQKRRPDEIGIHSIRGGNIVGEHEIVFAGPDEIITLSHSARSKVIFATGAYKAARFIIDKKPGLYNMDDLL